MKLALALLFLGAATGRADLLSVVLSTQRFTNAAGPIHVEAILTPCPECGASNHHRREIRSFAAFDLVTVRHVLDGAVSTNFVTGPLTSWSVTSVVAISQGRVQPGWVTPRVALPGAAAIYPTNTNAVAKP